MKKVERTEKVYGFLWRKYRNVPASKKWHFNYMQEVIDEPIVRGVQGIDIGSGCGYDTYIMAKNNPSVKIISIDLSDGIYRTKKLTSELKNVQVIKCSVSNLPFKDKIFDFAYSFGVLHHTVDPQKSLLEISRILKKDCPVSLYVYEDHSEDCIKYIAVKIVANLRKITVRIPSKIIYFLSWIFSPLVFIIFSVPSKILRKFKAMQYFSKKMPFNFGTDPFSLRGDLYDRFSAPIEHRFNRQQVYNLFTECGFKKINITRLKAKAGWVLWGYKK